MKNINYLFQTLFIVTTFLLTGCDEESYTFGDVNAPANLQLTAEIIGVDADNPFGDGTGVVNFTATADNVITYKYLFEGEEEIAPSGALTIPFTNTGIHTYNVTVLAIGVGGVTSSITIEVEVWSDYSPSPEFITWLTADSSRTWRIKAEVPGHMGVGPAEEVDPVWWSANPGDKAVTGMYDDRYVFNVDGTFTHLTQGTVFGQADPLNRDFGDLGLTPNPGGEHENYPLEDYVEGYTITAPDEMETFTLSGFGFTGFYVAGSHAYTILSKTDDDMTIKIIGDDGLAWFFILTANEPDAGDGLDVIYTNLVWADEFDTDGAPNAANWGYDTGDGGWGNGESQYYTDRTDNAKVENGSLIITAKAENFGGSDYTSARLKTQGLYGFTYGRIDIMAKLPEGGGTWPAIWTLGESISTIGWPACGELDILEHVGNNPGHVQSAIHTISSSGATVNLGSTTIATTSSEFHLYSMNWSADQISFLVDDEIFYTYNPAVQDLSTWPFDANQFIILNIAMGGSLGGTIDPAFTESTMEIDYVRVYQ